MTLKIYKIVAFIFTFSTCTSSIICLAQNLEEKNELIKELDEAISPTNIEELVSNPSQGKLDDLASKTSKASTQIDDKEKALLNKNATENILNRIGSGIAAINSTDKSPSLMLEADEYNNVNRAIESLKTNQVFTPDSPDSLIGSSNQNSNDEKKRLQQEEEARKLEEKRLKESAKAFIYLSSILYFSPDNWVVWVNDQKITSKTNSPNKEFYLTKVNSSEVGIFWTLSMSKWKIISGKANESLAPKVNEKNQVEIEFSLKQNQTFILSQDSIIEGRIYLGRK